MLRMGFIEDVETIMAQIPEGHQTALSATMPEAIRRITRRFMKEPQEVRIQSSVTTRPTYQPELLDCLGYAQKRSTGTFPGSGRF
ncbi:hypothetical protein ACLBR5_06500 [Escherichia coli]